jgi:glycosyltransferase involved in cell wall biosynthesis
VLPSLLETFGHPLVEAMATGLPVIASNATSNPEIVGEAGLYFDPWSIESIGEAMVTVLSDEERARRMSEGSRKRAADFSWESTAIRTLSVLERAAGRGASEDSSKSEPESLGSSREPA